MNGGARIVQSIIVKNANAAPVLVGMGTGYDDANTVIKGTAKVPGSKARTLQMLPATSGPPAMPTRVSTGPTAGVTIPAGKTLKATIAYKAPTCVSPSPKNFAFGPAAVAIFADPANCFKTANPITVRGTAIGRRCWDGPGLISYPRTIPDSAHPSINRSRSPSASRALKSTPRVVSGATPRARSFVGKMCR